MKALKLLAVVALCIGVVGCDTNDFNEDFPDPATEGLPPYVAFDVPLLTTNSWVFTAQAPERGSFRQVGTAFPDPANLLGLRVRLPMAIGENVTVTYGISGTAEYGRDYRLYVADAEGNWTETTPSGQTGQIQIVFTDENPDPAAISPFTRDLRVAVQPGSAFNVDLRIELQSAAAPSGRQITVGRFPDNRDNVVTLRIAPVAVAATVACPAQLTVGQAGEFTATINATATRPVSYLWTFQSGVTSTDRVATHTFTVPGTYPVTLAATGPNNTSTQTCNVTVVAAAT